MNFKFGLYDDYFRPKDGHVYELYTNRGLYTFTYCSDDKDIQYYICREIPMGKYFTLKSQFGKHVRFLHVSYKETVDEHEFSRFDFVGVFTPQKSVHYNLTMQLLFLLEKILADPTVVMVAKPKKMVEIAEDELSDLKFQIDSLSEKLIEMGNTLSNLQVRLEKLN